MAGDWIKFRGALYHHPKFIALVGILIHEDESEGLASHVLHPSMNPSGGYPPSNETVTEVALRCVTESVLRDVTMCSLLRVWSAVNEHCKVSGNDAVMRPMTLSDLDVIAGFSGFADAMEAVGWVSAGDARCLIFKDFLEFNEPACQRGKPKTNAERQAEHRAKKKAEKAETDPVTKVTKSNGREEKRREEKRREEEKSGTAEPPDGKPTDLPPKPEDTKPPRFDAAQMGIPPALQTPEFISTWFDWIAYRRERRLDCKKNWAENLLAKLEPYGPQIAACAIRDAIANGWQGVFPEKYKSRDGPRGKPQPPQKDALDVLKERMNHAKPAAIVELRRLPGPDETA